MSRLLNVSNRLPVTVKVEHGQVNVVESTGGLATALRGPHARMESLWIGWPGDTSRLDATQLEALEKGLAALRTKAVYLTPTETAHFYDGFSNGVLWPLYHYLTDKVDRAAWMNWRTYTEVNQKFADAVVREYQPGDIIWIHDYQLSLVPSMIRRTLPEAVIGFFLHIPFPSSEVFRILPWRNEILEGMLGSDLIGFHTYGYVHHFARSLLHLLDLEAVEGIVRLAERQVLLGVFPIGIDVAAFESLTTSAEVEREAAQMRAEAGGRRILLGVDRLDYTKGLMRRLMGFERLLEREPHLREQVRFVQLIVPSREKVPSYARLRRELDETVGRINAIYGSVSALPVHCLYRGVSMQKLTALYQTADVMLVTPLRDGMNLVAKEYIACRHREDGVLVLSEFAGAAAELVESLLVNPYDVDRLGQTIRRALEMPIDEQRSRMKRLRERVRRFDAYCWARLFIETLESAGTLRMKQPRATFIGDDEYRRVLEKTAGYEHLHVILDYDGTLVPFAASPELARPDNRLLDLLRRLAARPRTQVHIVSGRPRELLEQWFSGLGIGLHAEHGGWSWLPRTRAWVCAMSELPTWKDQIRSRLERVTTDTPGSFIEEKSLGFAWHFRQVQVEFGRSHAVALERALRQELKDLPIDILSGEKVVEVRARGINKGIIVHRLQEEAGGSAQFLAIGDDRTDEDMFQAVAGNGVCLHVGGGPSEARYRLEAPWAVRAFLERLLEIGSPDVKGD